MSERGKRPTSSALLKTWTQARLRSFRRNPRATFFVFVFPLFFLVVFNATGSGTVPVPGGQIDYSQFFTARIGLFAVITSCYTSMIFALSTAREKGILKRVRGTPTPPEIFLGSYVTSTMLLGMAAVLLMFVVGVPAFGVHVYAKLIPAALVTLVLGSLTLAACGVAMSTFINKAESAPAVANITLFPLIFISGIFFPLTQAPSWLKTLADIFPLVHFSDAFGACFSPFTDGPGFAAGDLAILAAWLVAAMLVAARRFRWENDPGDRPSLLARLRPGGAGA